MAAVVIECSINTAVHSWALPICIRLSSVFMTYSIISVNCVSIVTDNNFDLGIRGWDYFLNPRPQTAGILISSKEIAGHFRKYFDSVWEMATR